MGQLTSHKLLSKRMIGITNLMVLDSVSGYTPIQTLSCVAFTVGGHLVQHDPLCCREFVDRCGNITVPKRKCPLKGRYLQDESVFTNRSMTNKGRWQNQVTHRTCACTSSQLLSDTKVSDDGKTTVAQCQNVVCVCGLAC